MTDNIRVRLSSKGQLVIPKEMRDALELREGSELLIVRQDDALILMRPEGFTKAHRGALAGLWGRTRGEIDREIDRQRKSWR